MQVWAVANQKGGVGKTTTVVTLAGLLAEIGYKVLLVDLDPHGSLTSYFRYDPDELEHSVYDLFEQLQIDESLTRSLIVNTTQEGIDLIPASTALATLERRAVGKEGMGLQVAKALATQKRDYDFVLIDSPPVLGVLMVNALAACSHLLVPVQTEFLALKGLQRMVRTIEMVNRARRNKLEYTIIPTFYDRRTQASVSSLRELHNRYEERISNAVVPVDTKFRNASLKGLVPSSMDAGSRGVHAYAKLLRSLLERRRQVKADG
ncbi:MAG: ParA family protein [Oceanospirillaceae bacterium]|jgi:chromosome partitioning protein|uniref:ParA family protein n=1 Tax=Marinobacterium litorale TaxID=404770 RepID=UPI0004125FF3|nr:ParA family protein [Marinobacterium litorale]MBT00687.1 ParA family protein [Oceanospirillaceae bacterium]